MVVASEGLKRPLITQKAFPTHRSCKKFLRGTLGLRVLQQVYNTYMKLIFFIAVQVSGADLCIG